MQKYSEPCFLRGFCIQFITITPKFPLPSGAEMSIISAPVPGRNRTLSGFLVSLTEGVPFIMKLHHRMLRHFIAASVIVLTSSFLIFELVASDRAMSA
ncbi:diguanylate cylase, partial [Escherichia coli]